MDRLAKDVRSLRSKAAAHPSGAPANSSNQTMRRREKLRSFASTLPLGVSLASRDSFPRPRRCKLGSAACAPCWFYALWRARICEGVTVHSRWAGDFCRAAGVCFLCLLLCLTLRQRRFQPVPVRPRHSDRKGSSRLRQFNRHGSCKQRHSKSPQHSFLPG